MADATLKTTDTYGQRLWWLVVDRATAPQLWLCVISTAVFCWLLHRMLEGMIPDSSRELVSTAMGFLIGQMVGPGYQFYLGSTSSGAKKDETIASNAATLRQNGVQLGRRGSDPISDVTVQAEQVTVEAPTAAPEEDFAPTRRV